MSALSSIFPFKGLGSINPRDRPPDPVSRLRATLESMPGTRKYSFTPSTRAEILLELYDAFWGPYSHLFLPNSNSSLPLHATLAEVQTRLNFSGAALNDPPVPGRPCGYIFKKGESCFRCKDCALDDSCVLCSRCFHATDHTDHNVSFFIAQQSGGCCDCGDVGAWRIPIECPYHPPGTETTASLVAYAAEHSPILWGRDIPPVQNYPHRVPVPPELRDSMTRTVAYALDFVLETLDYSPDETSVPTGEADLRLQPSADPMMKDHYCVVLWNDEKHSFTEVIDLLCLLTPTPREEAMETANRIDDLGRDVIEMSTDVPRVLDIAQKIAQIELGVTVRRAYDTFREQVVAVIIEWLLDLTRARLGTDTVVLKEVIAEELLVPRRRSSAMANLPSEILSIETEVPDAVRLTWLFLYHTKLWKKPRLSLKEIYASILGLSHGHKLSVAAHFANVYPRVIDNYLLVDREAETSIKYFALQLFTVPSAALHIVQFYNIVTRILNIITAFFTNQISDRRIHYPASAVSEVDVDSEPFKSKRFMPVFSDLRYLCHNEPVQRLIARRHEFITQFAQTCQLFMCINPNKRAANSHVEFETDGWISVFNVTLSLSRVIKVYGEAFQYATPAELVAAITTITHNILMSVTLADERLDRTKFNPIVFHDVKFGSTLCSVIQFDVLEGWVSFHHSLQWLLAELFKHVDTLSERSLSQNGLPSIRNILLESTSEKAILTIVDFPLRVLAMVAQIRTGLWVRNGFAIRGQLLHYRDFMLRELCYDQDLYILQTALIILDPDMVFVSMMDRFQLLHFFEGGVVHPSYDPQQLLSMVEEFLYILITILSEGANASKMPIKDAVRREIVHALAVGPCTFTDLVKRVAERLVEDACFERMLREVANFRAPEATADSGMYELKPEAFDEINPFFYHYTRNKREEVETVLRNHWKKRGVQDPVIVPRPLGITGGPFAALTAAFESEVLLQALFYTVFNILVLTEVSGTTPSSGEAILDQTLQLIMLALVERPGVFSHLSATKPFEDGKNLIDMLCVLEHHELYRAYKARCDWILNALTQHVPEAVRMRRRVVLPEAGEGPEDAKKRAARARQEAIMRQMKEQQASFVNNINDDDDYEDEDSIDADEPASLGTCIVCQEELNASKPFGALGLVQPSKLVRKQPDGNGGLMNDVMTSPYSLDRSPPASAGATFPPRGEALHDHKVTTFEVFSSQNTRFGLHASICSHLMHLDCFNAYTLSIRQRHRTQAARNHPESIPRKEYICPLCKSLGNVILPVSHPSPIQLNTLPFADWTRAAGISILKSKSDPLLDSLLVSNGTGELVFWGAQDPGYVSFFRAADRWPDWVMHKMVDSVMNIARAISQQSRHLRDRPEPEAGERGAGLYLPEDLVGYTIACLEIAQRGVGSPGGSVADNLTESQGRMLRGLITCLGKLAVVPFRGRPDEGREALRQAIIKRLLPEWSLSTLNPVSYPLLLRDPFTIVVETAAVAPEMLRHVLILSYYAFLARTVIGLIYVLNKTRSWPIQQPTQRAHENIFGDLRMFFTSVVRHSPVVEHASEIVFTTYGEARIEKLMYCFTLPFLRRAAILVRAVLPVAFPSPALTNAGNERSEYSRLLTMLGIPPLADLPSQDTLQTSLAGWCSHYGHSHAASQLNCGIILENPTIYRIARLPTVLDTLFGELDRALTCKRCNTLPLDAAICLICGAAVCFQSHCCTDKEYGDKGECNMHTRECGGVIGLYFLVKRCCLLYLNAGNGTFALAPYLDIHGEVDTSMRRGRRQFLHPARWEEVRKTWLNHGIPTLVARKLEGTVDSGGWESL